MSAELKLFAVHGHASFQTVAWAATPEDAVDAVNTRDYESNWSQWAREIPIERAVLITGDLHDMAQDNELWAFEDADQPDAPTLAQAIEILRERYAANQRAEAERNNGQIDLPLGGDSVSQDVSFVP